MIGLLTPQVYDKYKKSVDVGRFDLAQIPDPEPMVRSSDHAFPTNLRWAKKAAELISTWARRGV